MEISRQVTVNASADKLWQILGDDFNNISQWASFVEESHANPELPEGGGRVCQVKGSGKVVETITQYDDRERQLAFNLKGEKIPFFMQNIENTWRVLPSGKDRSVVSVNVDAQLMPVFSQVLSGRLSKAFEKQADGILAELKTYAETN